MKVLMETYLHRTTFPLRLFNATLERSLLPSCDCRRVLKRASNSNMFNVHEKIRIIGLLHALTTTHQSHIRPISVSCDGTIFSHH